MEGLRTYRSGGVECGDRRLFWGVEEGENFVARNQGDCWCLSLRAIWGPGPAGSGGREGMCVYAELGSREPWKPSESHCPSSLDMSYEMESKNSSLPAQKAKGELAVGRRDRASSSLRGGPLARALCKTELCVQKSIVGQPLAPPHRPPGDPGQALPDCVVNGDICGGSLACGGCGAQYPG